MNAANADYGDVCRAVVYKEDKGVGRCTRIATYVVSDNYGHRFARCKRHTKKYLRKPGWTIEEIA